jgi:hypothetical protein
MLYIKRGAGGVDLVIGTIINASTDSNIMETSNVFFMFFPSPLFYEI